ncbi:MAG: hypothetical protein ABH856_01175 [Patescibacteria group bacterium]|nr:hypothetical protein [Patescibacteria group bacterium]
MWNKKIITFGLLILLLIVSTSAVSAQEADELACTDFDELKTELEVPVYCPYKEGEEQKQLADLINTRKGEFTKFIEAHFRKKQPNSVLIPEALSRYNAIKAEWKDTLSSGVLVSLQEHDCNQQTTLETYFDCDDFIEEELERMYRPLKTHIVTTANIKRATILMEKYQSINENLRKLNNRLAETLGYYMTFEKKFKGFVPTCQ